MNNKAQTAKGVGTFILLGITAIVGLILLQAAAQNVGDVTNTITITNKAETLGANGASIYVEEYRGLSGVTIVNGTGGATIAAGNYTVTNNALNPTTGDLSVKITTDDAEFASEAVIINATAQPLTYDVNGGGRTMAGLIVLLMALAIAIVVISYGVSTKK